MSPDHEPSRLEKLGLAFIDVTAARNFLDMFDPSQPTPERIKVATEVFAIPLLGLIALAHYSPEVAGLVTIVGYLVKTSLILANSPHSPMPDIS